MWFCELGVKKVRRQELRMVGRVKFSNVILSLVISFFLISSCESGVKTLEKSIGDSISFSDSIFINDFYIHDTFDLQTVYSLIGIPDSMNRGGEEIISEFGADDYDLFYGKSVINAGHGYVLSIYIRDSNLSINGFKVGQNQYGLNSLHELKSHINILDNKDGIFNVRIEDSVISEIIFQASPL